VLFRAEDQSSPASARQLGFNDCAEFRQMDDRLLRFAVRQRAGACDESAIRKGLGKRLRLSRAMEQIWCADCRFRLPPVRRIWGRHGETVKSEVRHGSRHRADVERIARRDENHIEAVALIGTEQEKIVELTRVD